MEYRMGKRIVYDRGFDLLLARDLRVFSLGAVGRRSEENSIHLHVS